MQVVSFSPELVEQVISELRRYYEDTREIIPVYTKIEIQAVTDCCIRVVDSGHYNSFEERLVGLAYNLCEGHYLHNGNKRISFAMCIVLSNIEKRKIDLQFLKKFIDGFAQGKITKEDAIAELQSFQES